MQGTTTEERRTEAENYNYALQLKYAAVYGGDMIKASNYNYWRIQDECGRITEQEYPLKYSHLYSRHFFTHVFDYGVHDLYPWLDSQFPELDTIDAEYIDALLEEATEYGFFKDGWICVLHSDGRMWVHDNADEAKAMGWLADSVTSDHFYGGDRNVQRADYLRRWVEKRLSATIESSVKPTPYKSLYEALCGGFTPGQLDTLLSNEYLAMYDYRQKEPTAAAKPGMWASLVWALKLREFLPSKLSASLAEKLLKVTFGADVSKSQITLLGRQEIDAGTREPHRGTEVARIYNALKTIKADK
ncbi:hypothetical protein F1C16_15695 [Hymenobacter sp. NBH84]|uniref:hypothetical protein n=1 Tax=Hymenobacter sp. NBH84 TaxID=2596915 RepID=UPI001623F8B9|nr:hypothetical protein [Hymenobacter sp. NBH84]QNE40903.1 hypothetical protein F1C16_15695 [Hymenobacter sp. NBH84]